MYRRDMLKYLLESGTALFAGSRFADNWYSKGMPRNLNAGTRPLKCGWVNDVTSRRIILAGQKNPFLSMQNSEIKGSGKGKVVLLHKLFEEITGGPLIPHSQEIGDCVSHAFGLGIDILTAVNILMFNCAERWEAKTATEIIYGGSRIEAGERKLRGDGSMGVWAAEFVKKWGVLLRRSYLDGKYDYTNYSGQKARLLGRSGVPDDLEPLCREHPVKTCSVVSSWEECRDAVANGYPVAMCSNLGFTTNRDSEGFLRRTRRPWYHAMVIIGIDDAYKRPGGLVQNSWGKYWIKGPTRLDQPLGSFWVDAKQIDRAMKQGDSIAISGYVGYPRIEVPDYSLW